MHRDQHQLGRLRASAPSLVSGAGGGSSSESGGVGGGGVSGGTMSSWLTTSQEVFDHLVANFEDRVHTSRQVRKIRFDIFPDKVGVVDFHGETEIFDKVVIATDAGTALSLIQGPTWLQRQLLSRVSFTEDFDQTFLYVLQVSIPFSNASFSSSSCLSGSSSHRLVYFPCR